MKKVIKSIKYLCGGHGAKASDVMFTLMIHFESGDGEPVALYGYETQYQEGYIFNTMYECAIHYIQSDYKLNRLDFDENSLEQMLNMKGDGFIDLTKFVNNQYTQ